MINRICKYCGADWHTAFLCPRKPHKTLKATKPMNKIGKVGKQWMQTRRDWFKRNWSETYYCYICGLSMTPKETTLDHVKSRSRHPGLRYTLSNLRPCCWNCNTAKGSKDLEE